MRRVEGRGSGVRGWVAVAVAGSLVAAGLAGVQVVAPRPALAVAAKPADVTERPDYVSALLAARAVHHRVEVAGARDMTTTKYVNPDGTITADYAAGPVHALRNGRWVDIDTSLQRTAAGWQPKAVPGDVTVSAGGGTVLTRQSFEGRSLQMSWPSALPAPSVSGSTATYADVMPGADLVVTVASDVVETSLVLRQRPTGPLALSLPVSTTGGTLGQDADGVLRMHGAHGGWAGQVATPLMFDGNYDPAVGQSRHITPVGVRLVHGRAGQEMRLTPDPAFLNDPSTVYPVTIDPTVNLVESGGDTYITSGNNNNYNGQATDQIGVPSGTSYARTLIKFSLGAGQQNVHIQSADLKMFNSRAPTCTARTFSLYHVNAAWSASTVNWGNQPAVGGLLSTLNESHGYTGCGGAYVDFGVANEVQGWSNGSVSDYGFEIWAGSTTDTSYFKRFCSSHYSTADTNGCTSAGTVPVMTVTYNSYPGYAAGRSVTPCTTVCVPSVATSSSTPALTASSTDADGGSLQYYFSVYAGWSSSPPPTPVSSGWSGWYPQGTTATWQPAPLPDGQYEYEVYASDGTDRGGYDPQSTWYTFTVDTQAPSVVISSSSNPTQTAWYTSPAVSASWSASGDATGVVGYSVAWDQTQGTVPASSVTQTATTFATTVSADGTYYLHVRAVDNAGNWGPTATYTVNVGRSALDSPRDQDRTQAAVTLAASAPATTTGVRYQYKYGTLGSWSDVPTGDVTVPGTTTHPSWPWASDGSGAFPKLTWDMHATLSAQGQKDGLVQVQACFSAGTESLGCASSANVQYTPAAFGDSYATAPVGPGRVSLLTGDYAVDATDVSVPTYTGSLTLSRTATTLSPPNAAGPAGVFGPGWTASLPTPDAGAADYTLDDQTLSAGFVTLTAADGSQLLYVADPGGGSTYTYTGQGDAAARGAALVGSSANGAMTGFTLTDPDGTQTSWTPSGSGWVVSAVVEPGSNSTTSYSYDGAGLPIQVLGPVPPGVSCATPLITPGCRTLTLTYGIPPGGSTATRLLSVSFTAADPATGSMRTVEVAHYGYDADGLLQAAWDPRLDNPNGSHVATNYAYPPADPARPDQPRPLIGVTPPGLAAWTLAYDGGGRFVSASRADPSGPTATSTVAYDLPFTGPGAPVDLGAATTATWGQTADLPRTGTAVFRPDHVPAGTPAASDWPYAALSYLDVNGRAVNTADYGAGAWQITTTGYDQHGNVISSLSAGNRNDALNTADNAVVTSTDTATRAGLFSTLNTYNADGTELIDTLGPTHPVALADGTTPVARTHTHDVYDQGAPASGGPYRLVTTATVAAQTPDGVDHDTRTTRTGYDPVDGASPTGPTSGWTLRQPTKVTTVVDGGAGDVIHETVYNDQGQVLQSRMPADVATDPGKTAGTTVTGYYTADAGGGASCGNQPALAGLACSSGPAAQPTSGPALPVTGSSYNMWDEPVSVTETSGATVRTTTSGYDAAGRLVHKAVTVTPAGAAGTDVPAVDYAYDPVTGLATSTTGADGMSVTLGHDSLGRVTSYTDADGNTSATSYDLDGRPVSVNDGKGTTSYSYDSTSEHRGLLTGLDAGLGANPSVFSASYDADGDLTSQTYPNGFVATNTFDNAGQRTGLTYTAGGSALLSFTASYGADGKIQGSATPGGTETYRYDNAGWLASVNDVTSGGGTTSCDTRGYGYNPNSDRTSYTDTPGDAAGNCLTTGGTTTSHSYDQADRITDAGYSYDAFGRTLTVPSADAGGAGDLSLGYYTNGMVHTQTVAGHTKTWTLDPTGRLRTQNDSASAITDTNHYSDGSDSPAWIGTLTGGGTSSWTRNVDGVTGDLAATTDNTGTVVLQLTNIHGDVVATADDTTGASAVTAYFESTEFGIPRSGATTQRYAWLGGKRRSSDSLGGLTLMGVRLYDPATGRFLQTDPIPGGSANDYDYANQDPINQFDLDGRCGWCHHAWHWVSHHKLDIALTAAQFIPGIGEAVDGVRVAQLAYRAYRARKLVNVLRYTSSAVHEERYFQRSASMLRMMMEGDPVRDPGGMRGAVCFIAGGTCGSAREGAYRLVVHPRTRRIVHFGFEI